MRKIFIISISALLGLLFFLGIYNFAFKKNTQSPKQDSAQTAKESSQKQDTIKKQADAVAAVSRDAVLGALMDKKNKQLLYYSATDGTAWQLGEDGNSLAQLSNVVLKNIIGAQWSPSGTMVITKFNREGKDVYFLYNYETKTSTQLKDGTDTITWDGLGKKIIYKYFDQATNKRSINIANPDGSGWQKIVDGVAFKNVSISLIPLSSIISYWNRPLSSEETQLNIAGIIGGMQKTIFSGKYGADYLWSPDGLYALVSSLKDKGGNKMTLGTIDSYGSNYKDLGISTLVSKCTWSENGKTVYCAVPENAGEGVVMPDDYINKMFFTKDTFHKIDVQTGKDDLLLEPQDLSVEYDATNLLLSSTEKYLFFINRKDGRLYKIDL